MPASSPRSSSSAKRVRIALACSQCGARNYKTTRARTGDGKALTLKKFCKACNQHTVHIEAA